MAHPAPQHNPFMLLLQPEVVLAAIEKSERLGQLNRHLCRPLDKLPPGQAEGDGGARTEDEEPTPDDASPN
jgi:hypothetical protein